MFTKLLLSGLGAAAAFMGAAHAIVVSADFDFIGVTSVEGATTTFNETTSPPDGFPSGGVFATGDGDDFPNSFAVIQGLGETTPEFTFNTGSHALGAASAFTTMTVTVDITNDEAVAQVITWSALIFAGGTGIIAPDLLGVGPSGIPCEAIAVHECGFYVDNKESHNSAAQMTFGASFDGADLYDGRITVSDDNLDTEFNGLMLEDLRVAPNGEYYWWADTAFDIELGEFAAGETKTLTFFVSTLAISSNDDGCSVFSLEGEDFQICTGGQAAFGDPDSTSGVGGGGVSLRSMSFALTAAPIPVPAGVWLFLTAIGAGFGAKRLRKKA